MADSKSCHGIIPLTFCPYHSLIYTTSILTGFSSVPERTAMALPFIHSPIKTFPSLQELCNRHFLRFSVSSCLSINCLLLSYIYAQNYQPKNNNSITPTFPLRSCLQTVWFDPTPYLPPNYLVLRLHLLISNSKGQVLTLSHPDIAVLSPVFQTPSTSHVHLVLHLSNSS